MMAMQLYIFVSGASVMNEALPVHLDPNWAWCPAEQEPGNALKIALICQT